MHPHDDIVLGGPRVGHVGQGESTDTGVTVSDGDGLHGRILFGSYMPPKPGSAEPTSSECAQAM
jgi:hypothetical protein